MSVVKRFILIVSIIMLIIGMSFSNLAKDIDDGIFLIGNHETTREKEFIEETKAGQSLNDYEKEVLKKTMEKRNEVDQTERIETSREREIIKKINDTIEEIISKRTEKNKSDKSQNPKLIIKAKYDRDEITMEDNTGTIKISDDKRVYYNSSASVKTIRDKDDEKGNSPMLINIASKVKVYDFDESCDKYFLLPDGFVDNLIIKEKDNKYLSPNGIKRLNHIKVDLEFNGKDWERYDLYEYSVLYYLSFYEGVLGDYYR